MRIFIPLFMFRIYRGLAPPMGLTLTQSLPPYGHYTHPPFPVFPPVFFFAG